MHYLLLVVSNTGKEEEIAEMLAPYDENLRKDFFEIHKNDLEYCKNNYENDENGCREFFDTFHKYMENQCYIKKDDKYGYMSNNQGYWDWYVVGGRWNNLLCDKEGNSYNTLQKKDFSLKTTIEERKKERANYYDEAMKEENYHEDFLKFVYGIELGETKEEYCNKASFCTYAILDENGWKEEGYNGEKNENWNEDFSKYLISIPEEKYLTIVDCHC